MFESLHRRPRGRRAALLVDRVKGRSSRDEAWAAVMPPAPGDFPFERRTLPPTDPPGPITTGLTSQLDDDQLALLRERLPAEQRSWFEGLDEPDRIKVLTPLALAHDVPGAERATGLSRVMPPPDVHAMSHDDLATGGSLYYGDLVHEALATTGAPLGPGLSVLDFGCSSGRVVRVLETWEPDGQYAGCDPNGPAVRWAAEHLPEIDFRVSAKEPPLEWG